MCTQGVVVVITKKNAPKANFRSPTRVSASN